MSAHTCSYTGREKMYRDQFMTIYIKIINKSILNLNNPLLKDLVDKYGKSYGLCPLPSIRQRSCLGSPGRNGDGYGTQYEVGISLVVVLPCHSKITEGSILKTVLLLQFLS